MSDIPRYFFSCDAAGRTWWVVETSERSARDVMEFFGREEGDDSPISEMTSDEAHALYMSGYIGDVEDIPDGPLASFGIGQAFWKE